jgi:hypothetical protein
MSCFATTDPTVFVVLTASGTETLGIVVVVVGGTVVVVVGAMCT